MRLCSILSLMTVCLLAVTFPILAQPSIRVVGGDTVDWGRTAPGQLKRDVRIVNVGTGQLKISRVQPSCGCTTAPLDKTELEPGDTATVSVSINMQHSSGKQTKFVTIYSNDSVRSTVRLLLTADVVRDITVSPAQFPLGLDMALDTVVVTSVQLTNTGDDVVTLEAPVVREEKGLKIALDPLTARSLKPGESLTLRAHVTLKGEGPLNGTVVVGTSSRAMPEISIPVYGVGRKAIAPISTVAPVVKTPTVLKSGKVR